MHRFLGEKLAVLCVSLKLVQFASIEIERGARVCQFCLYYVGMHAVKLTSHGLLAEDGRSVTDDERFATHIAFNYPSFYLSL